LCSKCFESINWAMVCNHLVMDATWSTILNPCIYDDYKIRYYELTESLTWNNFSVTVWSPFSCIPYIKGGCYITWILLKIINPLKALAMPWLMCITLNVQYQFREFLKTQIWVKFWKKNLLFLLWFSLNTYWYAMTSWKLNI